MFQGSPWAAYSDASVTYDVESVAGWGECCHPLCSAPTWTNPKVPLCWRHMLDVYVEVAREVAQQCAPPEPLDRVTRNEELGSVYFIRFRDRVKIGFSVQVDQRLRNLPHDEVLVVIPGLPADERRCHAAFGHLREQGEWFRMGDDLMAFIDDLRASASPIRGTS